MPDPCTYRGIGSVLGRAEVSVTLAALCRVRGNESACPKCHGNHFFAFTLEPREQHESGRKMHTRHWYAFPFTCIAPTCCCDVAWCAVDGSCATSPWYALVVIVILVLAVDLPCCRDFPAGAGVPCVLPLVSFIDVIDVAMVVVVLVTDAFVVVDSILSAVTGGGFPTHRISVVMPVERVFFQVMPFHSRIISSRPSQHGSTWQQVVVVSGRRGISRHI